MPALRPDRRDDDRPTSRGALILAVVVSVIVGSFVPFGDLLLYPFTLFTTWVHEMGHGLAALATGGTFEHLELFGSGGGVAHTISARTGARGALVPLGGLVAPSIVGATP